MNGPSSISAIRMSFEHEAFVFDWQAFAAEMLPWISDALSTEDRGRFARLVDTNLTLYRCPYDGRALSLSWKDFLDARNNLRSL
jgi:hypothetical protein